MVLAWLIRAEVFVRVCEPGMGCVVYTGGGSCRGLGREGVHARVRKFVYVQACMFVYVYVDVQSMCTFVHPCSYMYAYLHVFINSFHILCLSPALPPPHFEGVIPSITPTTIADSNQSGIHHH